MIESSGISPLGDSSQIIDQKRIEKKPHEAINLSSISIPQSISNENTIINQDKNKVVSFDEKLIAEIDMVLALGEKKITKLSEQLKTAQSELVGNAGVKNAVQIENEANILSIQREKEHSPNDVAVKKGVEFLESVIPALIREKLDAFESLENLNQILKFGRHYLTALKLGPEYRFFALSYQSKILEKSQELLAEINSQINDPQIKHGHPFGISDDEMSDLAEVLADWKNNLIYQEEELDTSTLEYGTSIVSTAMEVIDVPLSYLPSKFLPAESILNVIDITMGGVSCVLKGLEIIIEGIALFKINKNKRRSTEWISRYQSWREGIIKQNNVFIDLTTGKQNLFSANKISEVVQESKIGAQVVSGLMTRKKIESLYEKRNEIRSDKIEGLRNQQAEIYEAVKALQLSSFNNSMKKIAELNALDSSDTINNQINAELDKWGISAFPDTEEAQKITFEDSFKNWSMQKKSKEGDDWALNFYVDHHATLEHEIKITANHLVKTKLDIEQRLLKHDFRLTSFKLGLAITVLVLTVTFAVLSAAIFAVPSIAIFLLLLTIGGSAVSLGISMCGLYLAFKHKPSVNKATYLGLDLRIMYTNLRQTITEYKINLKKKKFYLTADKLKQSLALQGGGPGINPKIEELVKNYQKAKESLKISFVNLDKWNKQSETLQAEYRENEISDFVKWSLVNMTREEFKETLVDMENALRNFDMSLASDEIRELLSVQIGVDFNALKQKKEQTPNEATDAFYSFLARSSKQTADFIKDQILTQKFLTEKKQKKKFNP